MIKRTVSKRLNKRFTYGPVPSRRLGYSLGIDIIPYKTCSYNCIYCQLGRTTNQTTRQKGYFSEERILKEIKQIVNQKNPIDYITFSGSGEPTINTKIKNLIEKIQKITTIPIAVITNSSLLYRPAVQKSLLGADIVLPTLTTANDTTYKKIHRPVSPLTAKKVIDGLIRFRKIYKGKIYLELMFIRGFNDSIKEIMALKDAIKKIKPDRVQLNTVVRPPSEVFAQPLTPKELNRVKKIIGENCEVVAEFRKGENILKTDDKRRLILEYLKRRPGTQDDICKSLDINQNEVVKYLVDLLKRRMINIRRYRGKIFYEAV